MWHDRVSHLICWIKQSGGGEEKLENREKERERRRRMREKLHLLSRFSGGRTVGFCRSKKESSSTRQELHVGMRI